MLKTFCFLLALTTAAYAHDLAKDEAQIWNQEKAYWEYVKANDLQNYRALWHDDFVGWPFVSPAPVRKDHITDWITNNTSKGLNLQSYAIEQLAVRVTGDVAIDHYRIKANWAKGDTGECYKQTQCGSRTPGSGLTARGKSRRYVSACKRKGPVIVVTCGTR